jgi:hypothetical protein
MQFHLIKIFSSEVFRTISGAVLCGLVHVPQELYRGEQSFHHELFSCSVLEHENKGEQSHLISFALFCIFMPLRLLFTFPLVFLSNACTC